MRDDRRAPRAGHVNRWGCDHPGCGRSCAGTGGAIGLRAIGWYFMYGLGGNIFCPEHRPDPGPGPDGQPCALCTAETQARLIQAQIPGIIENATDSDGARRTRELFHRH